MGVVYFFRFTAIEKANCVKCLYNDLLKLQILKHGF
jgi:hypothetical protein